GGARCVSRERAVAVRARPGDEQACRPLAIDPHRGEDRADRRCGARCGYALCGGGRNRVCRNGTPGGRAQDRPQARPRPGNVAAQIHSRRRAWRAHRARSCRRYAMEPPARGHPRGSFRVLRAEIESMPGRVRRLLRPRKAIEIAPGSCLDSGDVVDTEALIELVGACRNYAGELAVSEMTTRCYNELEQYLDTGMQALLDGLASAGASDRA